MIANIASYLIRSKVMNESKLLINIEAIIGIINVHVGTLNGGVKKLLIVY